MTYVEDTRGSSAMSAGQVLEERIVLLEQRIEQLQASIDSERSRGLPKADAEQTILMLREIQRTYAMRLDQMARSVDAEQQ